MRITSLFPAGTEIAYAIGAGDELVGVSHACDYPPQAAALQNATKARFDPSELTSRQIYKKKVEVTQQFGSLYRLDETTLWSLRSDVIITQGPGEFSLVSLESVRAIAEGLNPRPSLVILFPRHLDDVLDDHARVGFETGHFQQARELTAELRRRIHVVEELARGEKRKSVAFVQWLDPSFAGGLWVPQLIETAGGVDALNTPGLPPNRFRWQDLRRANPDVVVVACEDLDVERVRSEMGLLTDRPGYSVLRAVEDGAVYVGDGRYFTRAGPRLVLGLEALAWAVHPELFAAPAPEVLQRYQG